jgi:Transposase IS66 family
VFAPGLIQGALAGPRRSRSAPAADRRASALESAAAVDRPVRSAQLAYRERTAQRHVGPVLETFRDLRQALERKASQLLELPRSEPNEEAVRHRLNKQRDHLFTFLDHNGVDATNNLAERQLRPAVIARKVSCGNKTQKGARTWQILTSLAATCAQRATSFIAEIARAAPLQGR